MTDEDDLAFFEAAPTEDQAQELTRLGQALANTDRAIGALETQLKELKTRRWDLVTKDIPRYMRDVGQDRIGLPDWNVDVVLVPYFKANIAADWPEEKRQAAFDALEAMGHGGVIRVELTYSFGRDRIEDARALRDFVAEQWPPEKEIPEPSVSMGVPWQTLTALLRECTEKGIPFPMAETEAVVATVAQLKKR